ncbi:helix-turn-helix domain-containing protein [Candidatus Peregrinibacteria bacterium]|nr:helix-turn-helix domain-containing protein [Candidatus Peregrinibacteria bacterium]
MNELSRIKIARIRQNWTQQDLALLVGIRQGSISKIENGKLTPSPELKKKIKSHLFPEGQ